MGSGGLVTSTVASWRLTCEAGVVMDSVRSNVGATLPTGGTVGTRSLCLDTNTVCTLASRVTATTGRHLYYSPLT